MSNWRLIAYARSWARLTLCVILMLALPGDSHTRGKWVPRLARQGEIQQWQCETAGCGKYVESDEQPAGEFCNCESHGCDFAQFTNRGMYED